MAKSYSNLTQGTDPINKPREFTVAAPFDVRTVVDTYDNLLDKDVFSYGELYVGLLVITKDTQDVYVLSQLPGKRDSAAAWRVNIKWKKINSEEFDPSDYLDYFEENLGAKIINSADDLSTITEPYAGEFAVIRDNPNTSEDESGLYVYTGQSWLKIYTSAGNGSGDVSSVITSDGTEPTSGTGFSLSANDPDALIEETYSDDYLHAGTYYSSRGINSSKVNGGDELDGVNKIKLSNGGDSYVELYANGDMNLYIEDNTLGFNLESITGIIDANGVEHANPYAGQPNGNELLHLGDNVMIRFNTDVDFANMVETRDDDPTEYTFGLDGSKFEDLDFYSVTVLPTVYAYADGTPVRVLTEGDKVEILNIIENSTIEPITEPEILGIF